MLQELLLSPQLHRGTLTRLLWPLLTMLLRRPSLLSCVARSIMISRASGKACAMATKLYWPPTPLTTWPSLNWSDTAAPSKVIFIVAKRIFDFLG